MAQYVQTVSSTISTGRSTIESRMSASEMGVRRA
jgi:hypothetical protein